MAETVTLEFLGRQLERVFAELAAIRDEQSATRGEMTVLTSIVLRHDATLNGILDQLHVVTAQVRHPATPAGRTTSDAVTA
jgi:hypothetical protein